MEVINLKDELYQAIHDLYAKYLDKNDEETIQKQIETLIKVLRGELPLCACDLGIE